MKTDYKPGEIVEVLNHHDPKLVGQRFYIEKQDSHNEGFWVITGTTKDRVNRIRLDYSQIMPFNPSRYSVKDQ